MASKTINTILNLQDKMTPQLTSASKAMALVPEGAKEAAKQWAITEASFAQDMQKMKANVSSFVTDAAKIGLAAATAITAAAGTIAFSEAINMEGYRTMLDTAVKDTEKAGQLMVDAINFSNVTPFEGGELVEATAQLEAFGINSQEWLSIVGDAAAATNNDLASTVTAVKNAILKGEFSMLESYGVSKQVIADFSDGVIDSNGSIIDQQKMIETLAEVMKDKFTGGMEAQSKTLAGTWSTITGVTKNALTNIIGMQNDGTVLEGSLLDIVKNKALDLATTLQNWQADGTIDKISADFTKAMTIAGEYVDIGLTKLGDAYSWVSENANTLKSVMSTLLVLFAVKKITDFTLACIGTYKAIQTLIVGAQALTLAKSQNVAAWLLATKVQVANTASKTASTVATWASTAANNASAVATWALNSALLASPITWVVLAIVGLVAAGIALFKNFDTIKIKAFELWAGFKSAFEPLGQFFGNIWDGITSGFKTFINFIIKGLNIMVDGINKLSVDIPSWVPGVGGNTLGFSIPRIPEFELGTQYFSGGIARINERGGEIVNLPNGSQVIPHDLSKKQLQNSGGGHTFNITVHTTDNADKIASVIIKKVKEALDVA